MEDYSKETGDSGSLASKLISEVKRKLEAGVEIATALQMLEELQDYLSDNKQVSKFFEANALPLQEAWVGAKFGIAMKFERMRLAPKAQEGFDLIFERGEIAQTFDISEATDRTIDRPEFYKNGPDSWVEDGSDIAKQQALFSKAVGNRLKRKSSTHLVVYVNTGWTPNSTEIWKALHRWHCSFRGKFKQAYLLFGDGLVQIAPELVVVVKWQGYASPEQPENLNE